MSSSYVEVRETENGTGNEVLPFAIDQCDSNGLEIQPNIDGEPPKDHTYNKDPSVDEGESNEITSAAEEQSKNTDETEKGSKKTPRKNTKQQKSAKSRTVEKSPVKADSPKKNARKKTIADKNVGKESVEKPDDGVIDVETPADEESVQNASSEANSPKKRGQKRKSDEGELNTQNDSPAKKAKNTVSKSAKKKKGAKLTKKTAKVEKKVKNTPAKSTKKKETPSKSPKTPKANKESPASQGKTGDPGLPSGWTRKIVERKSGKTAGLFDIYVYSPEGIKFRSRPDIAAYLARTKSPLKLDDFNFTKKGLTPLKGKQEESKKESVEKAKPAKSEEKTTPKSPKKASSGASSKKGQKLVVKLNFTPKKKPLTNNAHQKKKAAKPGKAKVKITEPKASTSGKQSGTKKDKSA